MTADAQGAGTREQPWTLATPSGQAQFQAYRDETLDPPALVVQVGKTQLRYQLRCVDDLHAMLRARGAWMPLGSRHDGTLCRLTNASGSGPRPGCGRPASVPHPDGDTLNR